MSASVASAQMQACAKVCFGAECWNQRSATTSRSEQHLKAVGQWLLGDRMALRDSSSAAGMQTVTLAIRYGARPSSQHMEAKSVFVHIEETIRSGVSLAEGMDLVLRYRETHAPEAEWRRIRVLSFEADLLRLDAWLAGVLKSEPPPQTINGLWFGLFEPVREDGSESMDMYVCGSDHYEPSEEWHDWAVDPMYWPDGRYANSEVLHGIKAATYRKPELPSSLSDYALSLAYSGLFVSSFARRNARALLGGAASRALVVGHDSGDSITIGVVDGSGFRFHLQ